MDKIKVLVIEGSDDLRQSLSEIMAQAGCTVVDVSTGEAGIDSLKENTFNLILSSFSLPDMRGIDFCSQVRGLSLHKNTSLVLLTEEENKTYLKQAMLAGVTDLFCNSDLVGLETYIKQLVKRDKRQILGRILFVEDSQLIQAQLIDALTDMGLDVDAYARAEDAWDAYREGGYDLVLTDIVLEGTMSGVSLVRKIRRLSSHEGKVPIVVISGFDNASRRIELFQLGINDYIAKPIVREELLDRVYNQINTYHVIRELQSQHKSLHSLSMLDELTQLFNRHALREFSGLYLSDVNRNKNPLSFAILDIDFFSKVNEIYGRDKADEVLVEIGAWLKRIVREGDMIARWGSDEFVFLLSNCNIENAMTLMQRISLRLKLLNPAEIRVTASVGIATMNSGDKHSLGALFDLADQALHQAKLAGRDCIVEYIKPDEEEMNELEKS